MYTIKKCRTKGAFKGMLNKSKNFDFSSALKKLKTKKYKILAETPILVVVEKKGKFSLDNNGSILLKDVDDEKKAKKLITNFYKDIGIKSKIRDPDIEFC